MGPAPNAFDLPLFLRALDFAAKKHRHQRRKDAEATPYINHCIAVASILVDAGVTDAGVLCAAITHDVLEDTEAREDELVHAFGPKIASIVREVTDDKALPKDERKRLQIEHSPMLTREGALVKVADKIANLRDVAERPPADWPIGRRQHYFDWAKAVVNAIPEVPPKLRAMFDAAHGCKPSATVVAKNG